MSAPVIVFLCWVTFFAAYGATNYFLLRWVAYTRVSALAAPEKFSVLRQTFSFLAVIFMAVAPPSAELLSRILLTSGNQSDLSFIAFIGAWVVSLIPGILVSRATLKAGGIAPDSEA